MPGLDRRRVSLPWNEERRYRHLVETFALAVWECDCQGETLAGSSTWGDLTGQSDASMAGGGWLEAVHPDDRAGVEVAWKKSLADESVYQREYRLRQQDGTWVWTLAHAAPLRDEDGHLQKWLGMNVDITARKNAEHGLSEADRQKNEFISILAHELRNPLAPMRSSIDLLLTETATTASKAHALAVMSRQTSHMARLVADLIDASRITTGKVQVHPEKCRLVSILASAVDNIRPSITAKRQHIELHGLQDMDPVLDADPVRLNQVFVNLLNNSAKFSPEHSKIHITMRRRDDLVSVTVRDPGRSIPQSDIPNMFKLFVQSARHDSGDGLGIGMALASDVVKLHGGSIEARSAPDGVGAEFEVLLPVVAFQAADFMDQGGTFSCAVQKSIRVLVVDDNFDAAEALGALLEMNGHTLRVAHNGVDAVAEAATFLPDLIFMDIGMPLMGGLEATRHIRASNAPVRPFIVALTGWCSEADQAATRAAGCDMHLAKPADIATALAAVAQASRAGK